MAVVRVRSTPTLIPRAPYKLRQAPQPNMALLSLEGKTSADLGGPFPEIGECQAAAVTVCEGKAEQFNAAGKTALEGCFTVRVHLLSQEHEARVRHNYRRSSTERNNRVRPLTSVKQRLRFPAPRARSSALFNWSGTACRWVSSLSELGCLSGKGLRDKRHCVLQVHTFTLDSCRGSGGS